MCRRTRDGEDSKLTWQTGRRGAHLEKIEEASQGGNGLDHIFLRSGKVA